VSPTVDREHRKARSLDESGARPGDQVRVWRPAVLPGEHEVGLLICRSPRETLGWLRRPMRPESARTVDHPGPSNGERAGLELDVGPREPGRLAAADAGRGATRSRAGARPYAPSALGASTVAGPHARAIVVPDMT
jgi:hypothetical protein